MVATDDDVVRISALEHYVYCPRQCALIHVEGEFTDNTHTLLGQAVHAHADEVVTTYEEGVRLERALPLWSERYGLLGKADVVEFHDDGTVVPVEYKKGQKRRKAHDDVQLCAQALCLEEMLGVAVPTGVVFAHASRQRREVVFTPELRARTVEVIAAVRAMLHAGCTPPPVQDGRCRECSLQELCEPELVTVAHGMAQDTLFHMDDTEG